LNIWILQTGEPLQIDSTGFRPMRAINLSQSLVEKGHMVTLWSSDFDHFAKKHRYGCAQTIKYSDNLIIKLIPSRGYKNHISLSRLIDHAQLGFNVKKMLKGEPKPDVAFLGYPPIEAAWMMSKWLKNKKVPYILDVKDAWPEILLRGVNKKLRLLARLALVPYFYMMNYAFKNAAGISAPTNEFLTWCLKKAGRIKSSNDCVNPLTAPEMHFDETEINEAAKWLDSHGVSGNGNMRATFVGTLNSAFNFQPIINAAKNKSIQFVIAGDGPNAEWLKENSKNLSNIIILGWISSVQIKVLLERTTVMIAPFKDLPDFKMSTTNKFYDAMRSGLPIVSSISGATGNLISKYKIGKEYSNTEIDSLLNVLIEIQSDKSKIKLMAQNSRELYVNQFEFSYVYNSIVNQLEKLAAK
jgi:glycosyltransferase involved in cell wall biosynthesis